MSANLLSSDARKGDVVTTVNEYGGLGIGYLVNGEVWVNVGSLWACPASQDVIPMVEYHQDGGEMYRQKAERFVSL